MTARNQQMYEDFQLVYNNLSSNMAAGLTPFEISMYLTKAYFELVNMTYRQYEQSEEVRKALVELVETVKLTPTSLSNASAYKIAPNSLLFKLPQRNQGTIIVDEVMYIVYEAVTYSNAAPMCLRGKTIEVLPVSHDDFHQIYENPYRFNENRALRLDIQIPNVGRISEIITKDSHVAEYTLRYLRKPKPIILENLTGTDRIEGLQLETECEVNTMLHPQIVRLAAQKAYQDYKAA